MSQGTRIVKWLDANKIDYTVEKTRDMRSNTIYTITLETDCEWVNGFGKPIKYNKVIRITDYFYSGYGVVEVTGYSLSHSLYFGNKQEGVINALERRLKNE